MDLRYGSNVLMTILSADTALKAKLDTFTVGTTEYPAIFVASVLPENRQGLTKYLQIYRVSQVGAGDFNEVTYTVNVRQPTEYECDVVAKMVYDLTNRKFTDYSGVSIYLRSSVARAIMDAENNWFVPVDIRISSKL
jgi:hypothetical protein